MAMLPRSKAAVTRVIGACSLLCSLLLAASCAEDLSPLLRQISSDDESTRYRATVELSRRQSPEALTALRGRIQDSSTRVRVAVARALSSYPERAERDLVHMLNDNASEVRIAAIEGLLTFQTESSIEGLLDLHSDRDPSVRQLLRQGLIARGLSGEEQVRRAAARRREGLIDQTASGAWSRRHEAVRELARCSDQVALEALFKLAHDRDPVVATAATWGIGRAGIDAGNERLRLLIGHQDSRIVTAVLEGLRQAPPREKSLDPLPELCELMLDEELGLLATQTVAVHSLDCDRRELVEALESGESGERSRASVAIVATSRSAVEADEIYLSASEYLWQHGSPEQLVFAATIKGSPEQTGRRRIQKEIGQYLDHEARWVPFTSQEPVTMDPDASSGALTRGHSSSEAIAAILDAFPPREREWIEIFPSGGSPGVVAQLLIIGASAKITLNDSRIEELTRVAPDQAVKNAALWYLARSDDLESDDPAIRAIAAEALERRAPELSGSVKARLAFLLADESPRVRWAAALTLAETGDSEAVRPLEAAFERWHEPQVARALGELGQRSSAPLLARSLEAMRTSASEELIVALLLALSRLGSAEQAEVIAPFLSEPSEDVRRAAVVAGKSIGGARLSRLVDERRFDFSRAVREAASLTVR